MLSPDSEFSKVGSKSRINYYEPFANYKILLADESDPMYKKILGELTKSVFGVERNICSDKGEYASEIEEFKKALAAKRAMTEANAGPTSLPMPGTAHSV